MLVPANLISKEAGICREEEALFCGADSRVGSTSGGADPAGLVSWKQQHKGRETDQARELHEKAGWKRLVTRLTSGRKLTVNR